MSQATFFLLDKVVELVGGASTKRLPSLVFNGATEKKLTVETNCQTLLDAMFNNCASPSTKYAYITQSTRAKNRYQDFLPPSLTFLIFFFLFSQSG